MIDVSLSLGDKQNVEEANRCYSIIVSNLKKLQKEHSELEIKMATMLIGGNVSWRLEPTNIERCKIECFEPEEGFADFRGAFLELQDKLSRSQYMAHSGKIATPFIALITGGTLFSKFKEEIEILLNNGWFCKVYRAVGIIGKPLTDFDKDSCKPFVGNIENIFQKASEIQEFNITLGPGNSLMHDGEKSIIPQVGESSFLTDEPFWGKCDENPWDNVFDFSEDIW